MRRIGLVAVAVLGLPLAVFAQRAGGSGGGVAVHAGAVSAPVAAARVSAPVGAHPVNHVAVATHMVPGGHVRTSSPNRIVTLNPRFGNSNFVSNDVPGLGFDYPHLAAVGPKRGQNGRGFGFRQTVPFGFGGYLITSPEIVVENPQAVEEAQATEDQGDLDAEFQAAQAQAYRAGQQSVARQQAVPPPPPAPEPAADPASYVFVMRDGSMVFAVAYTWENGTLRYVTPEGQRKSVAADSLDVNATTKFNESQGLNFRAGA
ncbi:MAG: hypothetical protein JO119_18650 [Acidobacteria bacterium]|nr:hypothetical protein [Acidobacteriota bacterium]